MATIKQVKITLAIKEEKTMMKDGDTFTTPRTFKFKELKEQGISLNTALRGAIADFVAELSSRIDDDSIWDESQSSLEDF